MPLVCQTNLSDFLEDRVNRIVRSHYEDEARILRIPIEKVPVVPRLTVRVMATRSVVVVDLMFI